ncbi:uncharacterized protein LOC142771513 [Rhipicephalus microplus]|uniref:uncharacterized protein LOC142771513 n=1 Tax=Rhipicephalus microplus TaxID=6941 RepID=UPI003F6CCD2A
MVEPLGIFSPLRCWRDPGRWKRDASLGIPLLTCAFYFSTRGKAKELDPAHCFQCYPFLRSPWPSIYTWPYPWALSHCFADGVILALGTLLLLLQKDRSVCCRSWRATEDRYGPLLTSVTFVCHCPQERLRPPA